MCWGEEEQTLELERRELQCYSVLPHPAHILIDTGRFLSSKTSASHLITSKKVQEERKQRENAVQRTGHLKGREKARKY